MMRHVTSVLILGALVTGGLQVPYPAASATTHTRPRAVNPLKVLTLGGKSVPNTVEGLSDFLRNDQNAALADTVEAMLGKLVLSAPLAHAAAVLDGYLACLAHRMSSGLSIDIRVKGPCSVETLIDISGGTQCIIKKPWAKWVRLTGACYRFDGDGWIDVASVKRDSLPAPPILWSAGSAIAVGQDTLAIGTRIVPFDGYFVLPGSRVLVGGDYYVSVYGKWFQYKPVQTPKTQSPSPISH